MSSHNRTATNILALILLAAAWATFGPAQLGGLSSYVIINGNSMEPLYHRGDMVILHTAPEYHIGEIVTYRHPQIGPVIHRIIGRNGERWVFKGDHNDFIDPYQPSSADLIGRAWLYVPGVGSLLERIRSPLTLAILVVVGVITMGMTASNSRRRRGASRQGQQAPAEAAGSGGVAGALLGALALAAAALLGFALVRPEQADVAADIPFEQAGAFSYSAAAPPGIYDTLAARSGEPIFRALATEITTRFDYELRAEDQNVHGSYKLLAEVSAGNGWSRTIELHPEQTFDGGSFSVEGTLDLAQIQSMIDELERRTGYEERQFTITIAPDVAVEGSVAGEPLSATFAPRLKFQMDEIQLVPQLDRSEGTDLLRPSSGGMLKHSTSQPATLSALGVSLSVANARVAGAAGLALALLAAAVLYGPGYLAARRDPAARIRLQYGPLLVDAASVDGATDQEEVHVASMADLARLAERHGTLVIHEQHGEVHRYTVRDNHRCYSYLALPPSASPVADAAPENELQPAAWHARFLATLNETGVISDACRAAGVSMVCAFQERERAPEFASAWRAAQSAARARGGMS